MCQEDNTKNFNDLEGPVGQIFALESSNTNIYPVTPS